MSSEYTPLTTRSLKLLVTGSNGFLAGSILAQCPAHWTLYALSRQHVETIWPSHIIPQIINLDDQTSLITFIRTIKPDAIIHTAAISNIDTCESNKSLAQHVNVGLTSCIVNAAREVGSKVIFCSTDTVFDGITGNYSEEHQPGAVNYYAETKIQAEQLVLQGSPTNVVARLSLIVGLPLGLQAGNSFLSSMIAKLKNGEVIQIPYNETRSPVDVISAGRALLELAEISFDGVIHLAGNTSLTRLELSKIIALIYKLPDDNIIGINSNALVGRAPRPNNASLNNSKAGRVLNSRMQSIEDGIRLSLNFRSTIY